MFIRQFVDELQHVPILRLWILVLNSRHEMIVQFVGKEWYGQTAEI
jgi:hypothetical protein